MASDVEEMIENDIKKGLIPCTIILTYGTTNTCGFDQIIEYKDIVKKYKLWLHIDAAYAGPSLILPEYNNKAKEIEEIATSYNFNGSKWFLCGFDSAFLFVRDKNLLISVYAATGDYLSESHDNFYSPEFKDWEVHLGRKFRSLRIWMVIKYFGINGIKQYLIQTIKMANKLRTALKNINKVILPVETDLGLVCFRLNNDSQTMELAKILLDKENYNCINISDGFDGWQYSNLPCL